MQLFVDYSESSWEIKYELNKKYQKSPLGLFKQHTNYQQQNQNHDKRDKQH